MLQESLANAKISVRQQCVYEGPWPSEETYGKSTQETSCWKVHSVVTTLSLSIQVYVLSFSCYCLPNLRTPRKFELITVQGHPRSSILVSIDFLSSNLNFDRISHRDIAHLAREKLVFRNPPLFDAHEA